MEEEINGYHSLSQMFMVCSLPLNINETIACTRNESPAGIAKRTVALTYEQQCTGFVPKY